MKCTRAELRMMGELIKLVLCHRSENGDEVGVGRGGCEYMI